MIYEICLGSWHPPTTCWKGGQPPEKQALLPDAISDAARRGGNLTTALLAKDANRMLQSFDLNLHLGELQALLTAQCGQDAEIQMEVSGVRAPVKLDTAAFDAAVLELVANARNAIMESGIIRLRTKRVGRRMWVIVADSGCGMTPSKLHSVLHGTGKPGTNGTGLGRVRHFADEAHSRLHYRSRAGEGTVAALAIPMTLFLGARREPGGFPFPPARDIPKRQKVKPSGAQTRRL